ncbi:uncharacterized protein AMSG_07925 [Thecamonas trahens ATCC 50062]|uniref:Uncharacterized protein n=1 Tax=Thecamonas trahens ATCC 50062 TaxID=461836 RepID=A0A0L0DKE6_THETB|nr:hypothetical protein AMSG_07925 [Thecamonas trahens ATCC 50062]KNC51838.1 hypothetical protein AMSG_07925 [Thecamonas trahens ATCC 50062]|eukprot:XP_013755703.1 hypothetical protein AMSG_07925 [Thecamonas trahens ATCC 50062]
MSAVVVKISGRSGASGGGLVDIVEELPGSGSWDAVAVSQADAYAEAEVSSSVAVEARSDSDDEMDDGSQPTRTLSFDDYGDVEGGLDATEVLDATFRLGRSEAEEAARAALKLPFEGGMAGRGGGDGGVDADDDLDV